jgi:hypothetical protein
VPRKSTITKARNLLDELARERAKAGPSTPAASGIAALDDAALAEVAREILAEARALPPRPGMSRAYLDTLAFALDGYPYPPILVSDPVAFEDRT